MEHEMWVKAEDLVRTKITGHRKGLPDVPMYQHSFRVAERLEKCGYSVEVCLAGLLHDIAEDGGVTFEELRHMGFSERVVALVQLCSHDATIVHKDSRWLLMIAELVRAADADAWAIKLADALDNLADAHAMSPDRAKWTWQVKAPFLLRLSERHCSSGGLWRELREVVGAMYPFT